MLEEDMIWTSSSIASTSMGKLWEPSLAGSWDPCREFSGAEEPWDACDCTGLKVSMFIWVSIEGALRSTFSTAFLRLEYLLRGRLVDVCLFILHTEPVYQLPKEAEKRRKNTMPENTLKFIKTVLLKTPIWITNQYSTLCKNIFFKYQFTIFLQ